MSEVILAGYGELAYAPAGSIQVTVYDSPTGGSVVATIVIRSRTTARYDFNETTRVGVLHVTSSQYGNLVARVPYPTQPRVPVNLKYERPLTVKNVFWFECAGLLITFPVELMTRLDAPAGV